MFGRNRTVEIDPFTRAVLEQDAQQGRVIEEARQAEFVRMRAQQGRAIQEERERLERRQDAERAATAARQAKQQREGEFRQAAQLAWAKRRDELREQVAELRRAIQQAESVMESAELAEAGIAAGQRLALVRRLEAAEREFAAHAQQQPRFR